MIEDDMQRFGNYGHFILSHFVGKALRESICCRRWQVAKGCDAIFWRKGVESVAPSPFQSIGVATCLLAWIDR
jgi:hypothetical protein